MALPMNMAGPWPPEIVTPDFWPAREAQYRRLLEGLENGRVETIGRSAGGRELWAVTYRRSEEAPTFCVLGGMHGHEAQGPAACFNLLSLLESGADLKGQAGPEFPEINYVVVPIINPDARARMLNSFVGLSVQDVLNYDAGRTRAGERNARSGDVSPEEMLILGGLYNDRGVDLIRHNDSQAIGSPELEAIFAFIGRTRPDVCLELHAHCAAPQFYCPLAPLPAEAQQRQIALTEAIITEGSEAGYEFAANTGEVAGLSTALYHQVGGALPFLFESPQGVVDAGPQWDHARIIDVNLFVMSRLARSLV